MFTTIIFRSHISTLDRFFSSYVFIHSLTFLVYVIQVLQLRQYYYPHLHSSTNHHPVNVSYQVIRVAIIVVARLCLLWKVVVFTVELFESNVPRMFLA